MVPQEDLLKVTLELATRIAKGPPIALELAKRTIRMGLESDLISAQMTENRAQQVCHMTEDHKEGIRSFIEKRSPVFRGK